MGDLVEKPHKLVGSIIGEDANAVLDPIGGQQASRDREKAMTAAMNEAGAQLAALQSPVAEAPTPLQTLMTPTPMPSSESDTQRAARRRSQAEQAKRRGRASTILTANDDALGAA